MGEIANPGRRSDERRRVAATGRRWFTKVGDVEKGPFGAELVARSIENGTLKRTTLARAEDEQEWRPVGDIAELKVGRVPAPMRDARAAASDVEVGLPMDQIRGTFAGGFLAGFFGGLIGFFVVRALAVGIRTREGANVGLLCGIGLGVLWLMAWVATH